MAEQRRLYGLHSLEQGWKLYQGVGIDVGTESVRQAVLVEVLESSSEI
jgi:hypothetical protein